MKSKLLSVLAFATDKQKYEHICLDDYIQSGEGGTALSYSHKDGKTLAKLFMADMVLNLIRRNLGMVPELKV